VEPVDASAPFDLQEYYVHPERYRSRFEKYLPCLDVLVNGIYWEERYPRLVTREWARRNCASDAHPRLKVIGDISCDIEGSIEITRKATKPDAPCFFYDPDTDTVRDGVCGPGPAIMAIDNLPCEFPLESSQYLSAVLRDIVCDLAAADWQTDFERLNLPAHLKRAVIVYQGELTPAYRYLQPHLASDTHKNDNV
jgi:saccharopine dehydrogenase (NAD+, L-lysine-forming)